MRISIQGIHFGYNGSDVLKDIFMEVGVGEVVSLVGPNGSGKSTLLKCINRILKPRRGMVLVKDRDVRTFGSMELARSLSYVPQGVAYNLHCTVFDAVLLGRRPHITWGIGEKDKDIVSEMLVLMGLGNMELRQFNELSGGERQKVLIARALAQQPEVMLLDEPTSNLDLRHQLEVVNLISSVVKEKRLSTIIAIHDLNLASRFSDRIVFLRQGRIYAAGTPEEVMTQENIRDVYGVDVVINRDMPMPHIIPVGVSDVL